MCCVPGELEFIVISFPAVPFTRKVPEIVVVVDAGKVIVLALPVSENDNKVNVFAPVITSAPADEATVYVKEYVAPPPAKVRELALAELIAIPVMLDNVPVVLLHTVVAAVEVSDHVPPEPIDTVVDAPDIANVKHVTLNPALENVPADTTKLLAVEKASAKVYVPEGAATVTACVNCLPALVKVFELRAARVSPIVPDTVIPLANVTLPYTSFATDEKSAVPVNPEKVMSSPIRGISTVIVPVVLTSTTTSSCGNGTRLVHFPASDQLPPAEDECV